MIDPPDDMKQQLQDDVTKIVDDLNDTVEQISKGTNLRPTMIHHALSALVYQENRHHIGTLFDALPDMEMDYFARVQIKGLLALLIAMMDEQRAQRMGLIPYLTQEQMEEAFTIARLLKAKLQANQRQKEEHGG